MKRHLFYGSDLAYIHDAGFGSFARKSAPGLLAILRKHKIFDGLIVDLGCGSGILTEELAKAGYEVLGIDVSRSMIAIARNRVPKAKFRTASIYDTELPPCNAVMGIGECFNYVADSNHDKRLAQLFAKTHTALRAGGVFVFDIAEPGQLTAAGKSFTEGAGWIVLVEKEEDPSTHILTRRIITFRQAGKNYRRTEEIHRQRLYESSRIAEMLRSTGFDVRMLRGYNRFRLPKAHAAFVAWKSRNA